MSKVTEAYVLEHCLNNSKDEIEKLFRHFQDDLIIHSGVKQVGYHTPIQHQLPLTFDEWCELRYVELRKAAYAPLHIQLEMQVDGVWLDHINQVKALYPKPD